MISINDILFRVYRNPVLKNVRKVDVVEYTKSLIRLLNIPITYESKSIVLSIKDFRAILPKELKDIKGVYAMTSNGKAGIRIKASTENRIQHTGTIEDAKGEGIAYKHVPGWIYTEFKEGDIEIIYTAFRVDENNFPLLPENESLILAIENYIKVQYFTILVETGHMSVQVLERAEQQYNWYVGQASNSFDTPTEEEAESILNGLIRLMPDRDAFFTDFKYSSNTEKLRTHD